jgi:DNA repair protein RecO (recombination protein O)
MQRVFQTPAFLLHHQPWKDSGRILELLSREHGRLSVFAVGVRGAKARLAGVLQPFVPLLVSWAGRGEAPRLTDAELAVEKIVPTPLPAARLMSAYYLSELVMNLSVRHDACPELHDLYSVALAGLRQDPSESRVLRLFEKRLLDALGYGIPTDLCMDIPPETRASLAAECLDDPLDVERVRPLLRRALAQCLEGRALRTRVVARALLHRSVNNT